jgi:16S rRNA (cytidine1402-2'-O)-methyltransferase
MQTFSGFHGLKTVHLVIGKMMAGMRTYSPGEKAAPALFLIPASLGGDRTEDIWPAGNLEKIRHIRTFIVENLRSARRFLRAAGFEADFSEVRFHLLNKHTSEAILNGFLDAADRGEDTGLLSEAGSPCVADPGQAIVRLAHRRKIQVIPLVGASSILLGLMASGFNGQQFAFHGYLPVKAHERQGKIRELERQAYAADQTQVFMETPFRNNVLMEDLLAVCLGKTMLCVACDLSLPSEYIRTRPVAEWKKKMPDLHKRTSIFLLYHP